MDYNVNVQIHKNNGEEDDNTLLIVFICLVSVIVLGFIILALFMIVIKKQNKEKDLENNKTAFKNEMNNFDKEYYKGGNYHDGLPSAEVHTRPEGCAGAY